MSEIKALAWREWRSVRGESLVLATFGVLSSVAVSVVAAVAGSSTQQARWSVSLAVVLLFFSAAILGAGISAGDPGLGFLDARPVSRARRVLVQAGVRFAASLGIAAVTLLALALFDRNFVAFFAEGLESEDVIETLGVAGVFLLLTLAFFGAAMLASAFTARPVAAIFIGAAIAVSGCMLVTGLTTDLTGSNDDDAWLAIGLFNVALLGLGLRATMMRTTETPLRPLMIGRVLGWPVVALLAVVTFASFAWPPVCRALAKHVVARAQSDLAAAIPEYATLAERHPAVRKANESQLLLHQAIEPLLPVTGASDRVFTMRQSVRRALQPWREQVYREAGSRAIEPPAAVVEWLDGHADELARIGEVLSRPELPSPGRLGAMGLGARVGSPSDPTGLWENELDTLGDLFQAQTHLALARGQSERALAGLEARWRIVEALLAHDDVWWQAAALDHADQVVTDLRAFDAVPPSWEQRLEIDPFRAAVRELLLLESARVAAKLRSGGAPWHHHAMIELAGLSQMKSIWLTPWARIQSAREVRELGEQARALAGSQACLPDPRPACLEVAPLLAALDRLTVEMELTRATFALRRARAADPTGAWPATLEGLGSPACEGVRFVYQASPEPVIFAEGPAVDRLNLPDWPSLRVRLAPAR